MVPPRLTVLQGATASGKSRLALALAQAWDAEIIGADSMQVFEGMLVGTAAPSRADQALVPHHMVGCWAPDEEVNAARWAEAVDALLAARPEQRFIVVGGTNMWIRLWMQGLAKIPPADDRIRQDLEQHANDELAARLREVDPTSAARIHANDRYRMIRALAHHAQTGEALSAAHQAHSWGAPRYAALRLALLPDRAWLHGRIDQRAEAMYAQGLVDEAVALRTRYGAIKPLGVLGYRDALALADGTIDRAQALHLTARDTRRYARNQETWIRKEPVHVLGGAGSLRHADLEQLLAECLVLGRKFLDA